MGLPEPASQGGEEQTIKATNNEPETITSTLHIPDQSQIEQARPVWKIQTNKIQLV